MTKETLLQLVNYYDASKSVLEKAYSSTPEKFNEDATQMALKLFTDTLKVLKYLEVNDDILKNI